MNDQPNIFPHDSMVPPPDGVIQVVPFEQRAQAWMDSISESLEALRSIGQNYKNSPSLDALFHEYNISPDVVPQVQIDPALLQRTVERFATEDAPDPSEVMQYVAHELFVSQLPAPVLNGEDDAYNSTLRNVLRSFQPGECDPSAEEDLRELIELTHPDINNENLETAKIETLQKILERIVSYYAMNDVLPNWQKNAETVFDTQDFGVSMAADGDPDGDPRNGPNLIQKIAICILCFAVMVAFLAFLIYASCVLAGVLFDFATVGINISAISAGIVKSMALAKEIFVLPILEFSLPATVVGLATGLVGTVVHLFQDGNSW